jgi:hypothetical protein
MLAMLTNHSTVEAMVVASVPRVCIPFGTQQQANPFNSVNGLIKGNTLTLCLQFSAQRKVMQRSNHASFMCRHKHLVHTRIFAVVVSVARAYNSTCTFASPVAIVLHVPI